MAMAGVVSGSLYRRTHSLSRLALWLGLGSAAAWRRSTFINEPGELSQWLCHDDSTINIGSFQFLDQSFAQRFAES